MPIVTTQLQHIAVVGAGYMGGGIAQVFAMAGLDVVIVDADPALTRRHLERLCREAEDFEAQGLFEGWAVERFEEEENDGDACSGPKHWHLFHVVARAPAA